MVDAATVEQVLADASLSDVCRTQSGDCESVAVALSRCFDADGFVAVYEPAETRRATHAAVVIDGVLFDGDGRTSRDALVSRLEGFRVRDVDGVATREELFDWFERECVVEMPPDEAVLASSPAVVDACVTRLEESRRAVGGLE